MSQYYYQPAPHSSVTSHSSMTSHASFAPSVPHHHHHNNSNHRSKRSARYSSSQNPQNPHKHFAKQPRGQAQKDAAELALAAAFRKDFEAARSFDLEDDEMFCPWHLLTEDDLHSIHSASSDRSSSSGSESPDNSPLQHQLQPTPTFNMPSVSQQSLSNNNNFHSSSTASSHLKIHQPLAQRARNPIPIVDPNSRNTSPPNSISPARQAQKTWYPTRRW